MKRTERRIVTQDWYETDTTKTGWDSCGWVFDDGSFMGTDRTLVQHVHLNKFGNPFIGVAERVVDA